MGYKAGVIMTKKIKSKTLPFAYKLVLNQWLIAQCGFDPLTARKNNSDKLRPLEPIANTLRDCSEGLDSDNLHYFYRMLDLKCTEKRGMATHNVTITSDDLLRYEQNIVSHTLSINERRPRPIIWKYYQWLSLLFVEIYLDRYFGQRDNLLASLNKYVERFNQYWINQDYETQITPYSLEELNKICLQNATGSGKTLLMHVNFLQFHHYADTSRFKDSLVRTLLITPNESLSEQHQNEIKLSGISADRLSMDSGDSFSWKENGLHQVDYTEITKLSEEDGAKQIAIRSLGDQNLLLVDEAHRGMGSKEETGWFRSRERLVEKGFVFEYSATFKEAITAAKRPEIESAYTKNIIFDYSYRYFYEDGYGKDYRIFNLPESHEQVRFSYLVACLLSFYQQLKLYGDKKNAFKNYNLEKPLWVFVGKSVSKSLKTNDEKIIASDVALILQFIAQFLQNKAASTETIKTILNQDARDTGLLDDKGNDIFAGSFRYIKDLQKQKKWKHQDLLRNIFSTVFLNKNGGQLTLAKIKGDENEILLRTGQEEKPFGLINVGDASGLIKHIQSAKEIESSRFNNLNIQESAFNKKLFNEVHHSSSSVTMLLGSKKFVEGWDCWRVSTLGLMHVGRSEGAQIIQLFGRGVRLKGHDWTLKRSGFATPTNQPKYIQYLETLNVFGVQADFMERFKKFLENEGLPKNDQKEICTIPINITYDFEKKLKVLRPRCKDNDANEYDFKRDAKVPRFGDIPEKLEEKNVFIDWHSRIQSVKSPELKNIHQGGNKNETTFDSFHLAFLDYDDLFFRLERFKRERAWHNLNIAKSQIQSLLEKNSWYTMLVPAQNMKTSDIENIHLWQEMACELLLKYCEEFYNQCKSSFIEPRLELRLLTRDDDNFPKKGEEEYQLIFDSNTDILNDIDSLNDYLTENKQENIWGEGDLKACLFDTHLYKPLMHVAKSSKMQIIPASLNESEFQFVQDLKKHLNSRNNGEFYLLRNQSRGKGIGFFEAGNFYPDFLLWKVQGDCQYIAFIEPHGLQHTGTKDKKISFHQTIKSIQNRLNSPGQKVFLSSFIVTTTRHKNLKWNKNINELNNMNVYFMNENENSYISDILEKMADETLSYGDAN